MSTRKHIRSRLRANAERIGAKPSRYVSREFDAYQIKKYGSTVRTINKAKSTHKRKTWKMRIVLESI
jgi:hypothetical protein